MIPYSELAIARAVWLELAPRIRTFHVKQSQLDILYAEITAAVPSLTPKMPDGSRFVDGREYAKRAMDGIEDVIFPFDWFEVVVDDPRPRTMALDLCAGQTYRIRRLAVFRGFPPCSSPTYRRQVAYLEGKGVDPASAVTLVDYITWDHDGSGEWSGAMLSAPSVGQEGLFMMLHPFPDDHPFAARLQEAKQAHAAMFDEMTEEDRRYWVGVLYEVRAFCEILQHRGVSVERVANPDRPMNRQQRRAMEREGSYVEGEHYTIVLRDRLTPRKAYVQASKGICLKVASPKRRHLVAPHIRKLVKGRVEPLLVSVTQHVRGGRMTGRVNAYDATKVPVADLCNSC